MDAGNEVAGTDEDEDADDEGSYVEQEDEGYVELHGRLADVVGLRVETHEPCELLQQDDADAEDVTPQQSAPDDEYCKPEEGAAYGVVARSESL